MKALAIGLFIAVIILIATCGSCSFKKATITVTSEEVAQKYKTRVTVTDIIPEGKGKWVWVKSRYGPMKSYMLEVPDSIKIGATLDIQTFEIVNPNDNEFTN